MKDEYAIVLDFLPRGKATDPRPEPVAQVIGEKFLNLLEVVLKPGESVKIGERVYIGEGKRDKVRFIRGKIRYDSLTSVAKDELERVLQEIIEKDEKRFVEFFNRAGPITTRLHMLELLPGIGKKHMWAIIDARKKKKFESFEDLKSRVEMLPDPKKMIIKRIIEELQEKDRYKLFVSSRILPIS